MHFTVIQIIMFLIAYVCLYALIDRVGIIFIVLGALTVPIEWDTTFFLFALMMGVALFVARENCITD